MKIRVNFTGKKGHENKTNYCFILIMLCNALLMYQQAWMFNKHKIFDVLRTALVNEYFRENHHKMSALVNWSS